MIRQSERDFEGVTLLREGPRGKPRFGRSLYPKHAPANHTYSALARQAAINPRNSG
jgi:hypothetical protein